MHVTVCIATCNRGESIVRTLQSIVNSYYQDFDVIVVDQSVSDETVRSVKRALPDDSRLTYIRSQSIGVSVARNIAIQHAKGPLVVFTDDDCEVSSDWLVRMVTYLAQNPDVGLVAGEVRAGPHDDSQGFVPVFLVPRMKRISSPWLKWRDHGISANMAFRLDALKTVGQFDEVLGPGAPLLTAEDHDITYRVLKAGYAILNVPDAYVVHHGFRPWQEAKTLMHRSGFGMGTAYMKHLRLGDVAILPTLLHDWFHVISWQRVLFLRKHSGLAFSLFYLWGILASFRYRINRDNSTYIRPVR